MNRPFSSLLVAAIALMTISAAANAVTANIRKVTANGTELSYVQEGSGTPVIFVHGALTDQTFWDLQREAVASRYSFVAYSLRYHHPNAWSDSGSHYNYATHVADLEALIRSISSGPVHLVGHGMGANIALQLALIRPELLKSVTLVDPNPQDLATESTQGRSGLAEYRKSLGSVSQALRSGKEERARHLFNAAITPEFSTPPVTLAMMNRNNQRTLPLLIAMPPPQGKIDCRALTLLKVPTMVLTGAFSYDLARASGNRMAECIPGSEHVMVPGDHLMNLREPRAFNQALMIFMDRFERARFRT